MKKIKCKKCGYEISENLKICPFCGNGLKISKVCIIIIAFLFLLVIVILVNNQVGNETVNNVSNNTSETKKMDYKN